MKKTGHIEGRGLPFKAKYLVIKKNYVIVVYEILFFFRLVEYHQRDREIFRKKNNLKKMMFSNFDGKKNIRKACEFSKYIIFI